MTISNPKSNKNKSLINRMTIDFLATLESKKKKKLLIVMLDNKCKPVQGTHTPEMSWAKGYGED